MSSSLFFEFLRRLSTSFSDSEGLTPELMKLNEDPAFRGQGCMPPWAFLQELGMGKHIGKDSENGLSSSIRHVNGWGAEQWGKFFGAVLKANPRRSRPAHHHEPFNLYPSDLKGECRDLAVFLALEGKQFKSKGTKFLTFNEAIEKMIQHQTSLKCKGVTKQMLLITTSWDAEVFQPWYGNFVDFRKDGVESSFALWTVNGWSEAELG